MGAQFLLAALYVVAALLGLSLAFANASASPVWPPTGLAIAALLIFGKRLAPAVFVGAVVANLLNGSTPPVALAIAVGNTAEAVVAAWGVRRLVPDGNPFTTQRGVAVFGFIAVLAATMISASIGVATLVGLGGLPADLAGGVWLTWWLGDAVGAAIVAPFILLWLLPSDRPAARLAEGAAVAVLLAIVSYASWARPGIGIAGAPLAFACLPIIAWCGIRLGVRAASTALLLVSASAVAGTLVGHGPFAADDANLALLVLQSFLGVTAATTFVLGALAFENRRDEAALRAAHETLEDRVRLRTEAWAKTNARLEDEAFAREQARADLEESQSIAHIGSLSWDVGADKVAWSAELYRIFGLTPSEFGATFQTWLDRLHPEDRDHAAGLVTAAVTEGLPYAFEHRIVRPNGEVRHLHSEGRATLEGGKAVRLTGIAQDITDRVRQQREQDAFFTLGADLLAIGDATGVFRRVNPAWTKLLGWSEEELTTKPFVEYLHPDDLERTMKEASRLLAGGAPVSFENRFRCKDGGYRWLSWTSAISPETGLMYGIAHDTTERRSAEERFRGLLEAAPDSMVIADERGRIVLLNAQTERLFGYERAELIGQPVELLMPEALRHGHEKAREGYEHHPTARPMGMGRELFARRKDGSKFPVEISLSPLRTENGLLVSASVRDITARKQAEDELRRAKQEAEAAAVLKSQFLATMSHEIRTPLNAVIGTASILEKTPIDPHQEDLLNTIRHSGEHLLTVINDILDYSKIEAGGLQLDPRPFNPQAVVAEMRAMLQNRAQAKGLKIETVAGPDVPAAVLGDGNRVRQVLINLVGNAIKFTPSGFVETRVEAEAIDHANVRLRFTVRDTGIGIAPDVRDRLFKPFSQGDASTTRSHGGTGLGLAISSRLVKLWGGSMSVESEPGHGATFTFTMDAPIAPELAPEPVRVRLPPGAPPRLGLRVLLAEDNVLNQKVACRMLDLLACTYTVVGDGQAAVEAAAQSKYDVILMDVEMPRLDGLGAARKVVEQLGTRRPRMIAMTANAMPEDRKRCLDAGMDDYLPKPVRLEDLAQRLARVPTGANVPEQGH